MTTVKDGGEAEEEDKGRGGVAENPLSGQGSCDL